MATTKDATQATSLRLPAALYARFGDLAERLGRTRTDLVVQAMEEFLATTALEELEEREAERDLEEGRVVPAEELDAFWAEAATPEQYAQAERELAEDLASGAFARAQRA